MKRKIPASGLLVLLLLALPAMAPLHAQDRSPGSSDDSSQRTDESEEAYRRRMELEGARASETFSNTTFGSQVEEEKIDKLPAESQKNIRDQITDIIIENDQWEPSDVLEDYPYEPTAAAMKDRALRDQEQEAWAEQVDKYHQREAAAFGAVRRPMPGEPGEAGSPGSPGSAGKEQQAGGNPGGGKQGQQEDSSKVAGGGFDPSQSGQSSSDEQISTAGVSESALDFLRGQRGPATATGNPNPEAGGGPGGDSQQPAAVLAGNGVSGQSPQELPGENGQAPAGERPQGSLTLEELQQLQGLSGQAVASTASGATSPPSAGAPQTSQERATGKPEQAETQPSQSETREQLAQTSPSASASEATSASQQESENTRPQQQASPELDLSTAGIIAIRDLDKLEGVEAPAEENQP